MNAFLTARRIKKGQEEEFRKRWKGGDTPEGMLDAYLLEDEEDPRETLSISFWDTARDLLTYRTGEDAKKRRGELDDVVDKDRWSRAFVAFNAVDIDSGGGKKKLFLLPLLLIGVGAAVYFLLVRRKAAGEDEWDTWQPEPASTFVPPEGEGAGTAQAPLTATTANASPQTPPSPVRPLDAEARNGGSNDDDRRHNPTAARQGAQPAALQTGAQSTMGAAGSLAPQTTATGEAPARSASPSATLGSAPMHAAGMPAGYTSTSAQAQPAPTTRAGQTAQRGRTVREAMTPGPETVEQTTDVVSAARLMRDIDVGVIPVMAEGHLAGIVTDRDIALAFADRETGPATVKVMDVMTDMPVTVSPDMSVEEAARLMAEHQVRRLPVVEGTRLVGILSLGDLAAEGGQKPAAAALEQISEPAQPDR
jgi:CBS domain-containing protein/heme-degrading monooxygenase HmoA